MKFIKKRETSAYISTFWEMTMTEYYRIYNNNDDTTTTTTRHRKDKLLLAIFCVLSYSFPLYLSLLFFRNQYEVTFNSNFYDICYVINWVQPFHLRTFKNAHAYMKKKTRKKNLLSTFLTMFNNKTVTGKDQITSFCVSFCEH